MDKGWFPNFSVYCVKCNKRRNQVCYNPKTNHVYIHCACPESRSYYNGDLILWNVDSYGMFAVVQKDNTITGKNAVDGPTCPIPLYNCAYGKNTGIFAIETYEKALQQQQQQQPNMITKWFPCVPLKCMECDTVSSMLYSDGNTVDITCKCRSMAMPFQINTNNRLAPYWIIHKKTNSVTVTNNLPSVTNSMELAGRLEFAHRDKYTKEWDSTQAALQIPAIASNNNNSQIDNRRLEETDKRIVALQNEVHKLSNELETQTIMMRDEIGQLKRKLFRNELMCVICQTNQIDAALGCGHVFCSECAQSIQKCAFCRKEVQATEIRKLFL